MKNMTPNARSRCAQVDPVTALKERVEAAYPLTNNETRTKLMRAIGQGKYAAVDGALNLLRSSKPTLQERAKSNNPRVSRAAQRVLAAQQQGGKS